MHENTPAPICGTATPSIRKDLHWVGRSVSESLCVPPWSLKGTEQMPTCTLGCSVRPGENFLPTSPLQLSQRHPPIRSQKRLDHNYSQISEKVQVFFIFETSFWPFLFAFYRGDQTISRTLCRICKDLLVENLLVVNFEIHLQSSGVNSDLRECFFFSLCKRVIATTDLWP